MEEGLSDGDVLRLISFYEANPCLYDVTNAEYRNKIKKRQLETEIAQILQKTGKVCMYIHQAVNAGSRGRSWDYSEIARHGYIRHGYIRSGFCWCVCTNVAVRYGSLSLTLKRGRISNLNSNPNRNHAMSDSYIKVRIKG